MEFVLTQISSAYNTSPDGRPSARSALQWISQRPDFLLVYDGADGHYSVVENFLPPGDGGNVLITSRNIGLKRIAMKENSMEVQGMEDEDAISLLLKSAMLDDTDDLIWDWARQLLSQLGGIPLAIDQAGAYMHSCGCSIDNYLKLYTRHKSKLMRDTPGFQGASDYKTSTYGTWDISMKEIKNLAESNVEWESLGANSAIKLLRIFAFLDPANIPQELFKNAAENYVTRETEETISESFSPSLRLLNNQTLFLGADGEWDKLQFLTGIQVLLSFSFIKSHNHLYSMHLLVNAWSRNCIPRTEIMDHYERARELLSCSIDVDRNVDNYAFCKLLAPHIRSNSLHASELGLQKRYHDNEHNAFAFVFDHVGSWHEAEEILHTMVNERKARLGSNHRSTYISMNNLATIYCCQGRWDEAEEMLVDVMKERENFLGSHHPDTIISMANLASVYSSQGRWGEAEKLQVNVVIVRKVMHGSDHPDTLSSMANLAATYTNQGRWDEASELGFNVMNASKVVLGTDHPHTLTTMHNLASTYWKQGKWDEAEELEVDVVNAFKEKLGSDHPTTLSSMSNLALTYAKQGRWDEAEKLQVDVMNAEKAKLGLEHPSTLSGMVNLALIHANHGRWNEAEKLQVDVMNAFRAKIGSDHPSALASISNLASTYNNQGRWDEAEGMQVDIMNAFKAKFGSDHPDTLTSMANLASTCRKQGRWDEAEKLEMDVMNARKAKLGSDHPDTLN